MDAALTLTVVGCSGSVSGPDSPASAYLVQAPRQDGDSGLFSLLLDCGPGALGALYRYLDPAELDAVALSHLHPDHCLDLTGLYVASRYSPTAPWPPITVYGPPGTLVRLARAYDPAPTRADDSDPGAISEAFVEAFTEAFTEQVWRAQQQIGPLQVSTAAMAHPVPCYATRIEAGGVSLVYSGDTGPTDALVELAQDADVLLCESAFVEPGPGEPANPADLHLSGADAGRIATRAGVRRLILTHIPPWHDPDVVRRQAAAQFDGRIDLARAGERYEVGADSE